MLVTQAHINLTLWPQFKTTCKSKVVHLIFAHPKTQFYTFNKIGLK